MGRNGVRSRPPGTFLAMGPRVRSCGPNAPVRRRPRPVGGPGLRPKHLAWRAGGSSLREPHQPRPVTCGPPALHEDALLGRGRRRVLRPPELLLIADEAHHRFDLSHHVLRPPLPSSLEAPSRVRDDVGRGSLRVLGRRGPTPVLDGVGQPHHLLEERPDLERLVPDGARAGTETGSWPRPAARWIEPCPADRCRTSACPDDPAAQGGPKVWRTSVTAASRSSISESSPWASRDPRCWRRWPAPDSARRSPRTAG